MDPCILVSGVSIQKIVLGGLGAVPPVGRREQSPRWEVWGAEPPSAVIGPINAFCVMVKAFS